MLVYAILAWLRWVASSSPGYVHPDEFFQSPEITAGAVWDVDVFTPWEYQSSNAARSVMVP